MNYVLDSSTILKWFLKEENTEKAITFKELFVEGEIDLIEPDLLLYEFVNGLRYQKNITQKDIEEAVETLFDLGISFVTPKLSLLKMANQFALKNDITIYDACYIVLAKETGSQFVTADEKLFRKLAHLPLIKLLSQIEIHAP